ncbi:TonB-dependent receptor [Shewanella gelidii]|uniref:TonB-dependent receptor n=1 Tax=Shewanella gelidii TaxID=1642821 RepID=A0A917K056_9GAMM|nr:TonB-dependent receptor [Shewanella gelidii]MCL1099387.1 TonB-dependent receptor [Shewanella gelidii]GGI91386.1 TonB-dependent receptor [Shewanella gelidii]
MKNKRYIALFVLSAQVYANEPTEIETIVVDGRSINLLGQATSASEGVVGQQELILRPLLRTGEILEMVPGMVATQHSGTGKANQYFLRGFNLDHGTDFSTHIDGMPINMRTHGHGQGYTDLNFIIPETISKMTYKKGSYYAEVGDFSGAGAAHIYSMRSVTSDKVDLSIGEDNYSRALVLSGFDIGNSQNLIAVEHNRYQGPWTGIDEDLNRTNLLLKHTRDLSDGALSISFMGYDNTWNSADQIPARAVSQGLIDELGVIDDTVGGESSRYSVNAVWANEAWQFSAYIIDYQMNLWSNFTYFLEDENRGDQFEQVDDRTIYGGQASYQLTSNLNSVDTTNKFGLEYRFDDIDEVGLYQTRARTRLGSTRSDAVEESSLGLYWQNDTHWNNNLRTVLGARYDYYDFKVTNQVNRNRYGVDLNANSGRSHDDLFSLKGSLIYTLDNDWETYASAGQGFHSNDARGVTINIDPVDGSEVDAVDPLVRSFGYETGIRGFISDSLNTSLSLWYLELESELLFVGDAGNTEVSRASERKGVELTAYYQIAEQWSLDLEYAYSDAKFSDKAPEGNEIPGAVKNVVQAGLNGDFDNGWFGSLRMRYFGSRPLVEDGSVESDGSMLWNFRAGYRHQNWTFKADILNLTNSNDHDIDYFYESRLDNEPTGEATEDVHFHPFEPRTVRLSVSYDFK